MILAHPQESRPVEELIGALQGTDLYQSQMEAAPTVARHSLEVAGEIGIQLARFGADDTMKIPAIGAALLHDIGRTSPELAPISAKSGRLNPDERHKMETHTVEGAYIIMAGKLETRDEHRQRLTQGVDPNWQQRLNLTELLGISPLQSRRIAEDMLGGVLLHHSCSKQDKTPYPSQEVIAETLERAGLPPEPSLRALRIAQWIGWVDTAHAVMEPRPYDPEESFTPFSLTYMLMREQELPDEDMTVARTVEMIRDLANGIEAREVTNARERTPTLAPGSWHHILTSESEQRLAAA